MKHNTIVEDCIIVVSGIHRSGMSAMMKMLEAGGIPIYQNKIQDKATPNKQLPTEAAVLKRLKEDPGLATRLFNHCLKIPAVYIPRLPKKYRLKLILMERDMMEIYQSQKNIQKKNKRKIQDGVVPSWLVEKFIFATNNAKKWASENPNVELLSLQYAELVKDPRKQAIRIAEFLGSDLDIDQMTAQIDPNLYRVKASKYIRTDRSPVGLAKIIEKYTPDKIFCEIGIGDGHLLNEVRHCKSAIGIEREIKLVAKCKFLYPHLKVFHGDFLKMENIPPFDVCYLWIVYPFAQQIADKVLANNEAATVILGLNYFYHLEPNSEKSQKYINAYPKIAKADQWNALIDQHLADLRSNGFQTEIKQVPAQDDEIFNVAIIRKMKNLAAGN